MLNVNTIKIKLAITLLLYLISLNIFGKNTQSNNRLVISSQKKLITHAFIYLNNVWSTKGKALSQSMTEKYFDPDTTLIINGKKVYKGYNQFDGHFREVGKYIIGSIRFPLLETISSGDKFIVRFDEDIHDNNGISYPANVIAIFTFHNGRIQTWEEVAYTKYFCEPSSVNAVYSK